MLFENIGFPRNYEVRILPNLPTHVSDFNFKAVRAPITDEQISFETRPHDANAVLLEITTSKGNVWTGGFQAGPEGLSGCFATPNPDTLSVVIQGQGYWISTLQPRSYEVVPSVPIKQVLRIPDRSIILFVDFVRLTAYGNDGFLWRSDDLSWDGIQITGINAQSIHGLGWDSPANRQAEFRVDVSTGMSIGGSSPARYSQST